MRPSMPTALEDLRDPASGGARPSGNRRTVPGAGAVPAAVRGADLRGFHAAVRSVPGTRHAPGEYRAVELAQERRRDLGQPGNAALRASRLWRPEPNNATHHHRA